MKNTGIIRTVESLGRIVIASEIRKGLGWIQGDFIEVYVEKNKIIVEKNTSNNLKGNLGVTRGLDGLGRIVIPKEIREKFDINEGDKIQTFVEGKKIILQKYKEDCIFCGNTKELTDYKGKKVCNNCLHDMIEKTA